MVLMHLQSPHGLKEGILKYDYAKEVGYKQLEGGMKAHNNIVVNVGRRGSMYLKLSSLKTKLVLAFRWKRKNESNGRSEWKFVLVHVPRFYTLVKY